MIDDPIVDEIHLTRGHLLAECKDDLDALLDHYQSLEKQDRDHMITPAEVQNRRTPVGLHRDRH